jgi:cathepsin D
MGGLNHSLYTGEIDYISLPTLGSYWQLPLTSLWRSSLYLLIDFLYLGLTVGNVSIPLPSGSDSYGAIDTGTTLIGGPPALIDQIAAQVPGSTPGTGDYKDYFFYRTLPSTHYAIPIDPFDWLSSACDSAVPVSISFGGRAWTISPRDFRLLRLRTGNCVSAFFRLSISGSAPKFIIGGTFLKTVYSVFQYEPPMVGFADLSTIALGLSAVGQPLPTPSLGASIIIKGSASASQVPPIIILFCLLLSASFLLFI